MVPPLKSYPPHYCANLGSGDISIIMDYNIKQLMKNTLCLCIRQRRLHCVVKVECPSGLISGAVCKTWTLERSCLCLHAFHRFNKEMWKTFSLLSAPAEWGLHWLSLVEVWHQLEEVVTALGQSERSPRQQAEVLGDLLQFIKKRNK